MYATLVLGSDAVPHCLLSRADTREIRELTRVHFGESTTGWLGLSNLVRPNQLVGCDAFLMPIDSNVGHFAQLLA